MRAIRTPRQAKKPHLTTHILDVMHPFGLHISQPDCHSLASLPGVFIVTCDEDSGHLEIKYDLDKIHLDDIEEHLTGLGYLPKGDLYHRVRNGLAHFVEMNESIIHP